MKIKTIAFLIVLFGIFNCTNGDCQNGNILGATSTCYQSYCGDALAGDNEVCDGNDLKLTTCKSLGFLGGSLSCKDTCDGFDTSQCF